MTRHLVAASLAVVMLASPAIAFAQSSGTTSTYSDTAPKSKSTHKSSHKSTHKAAAHKSTKSKTGKKTAS